MRTDFFFAEFNLSWLVGFFGSLKEELQSKLSTVHMKISRIFDIPTHLFKNRSLDIKFRCHICFKIQFPLNDRVHRFTTHVKRTSGLCLLTGLNVDELASLNSVVDKLEHGWAGQVEQCCWQACSCMSEQTIHGLMNADLNSVVGTIIINQQRCSYMIEYVVRKWWNNKIEQRCYNNHELGCCIKSGLACSNIREQLLSIRQVVCIQYVETSLNNTVILPILLTVYYRVVEPTTVIACDIFSHVAPTCTLPQ